MPSAEHSVTLCKAARYIPRDHCKLARTDGARRRKIGLFRKSMEENPASVAACQ